MIASFCFSRAAQGCAEKLSSRLGIGLQKLAHIYMNFREKRFGSKFQLTSGTLFMILVHLTYHTEQRRLSPWRSNLMHQLQSDLISPLGITESHPHFSRFGNVYSLIRTVFFVTRTIRYWHVDILSNYGEILVQVRVDKIR